MRKSILLVVTLFIVAGCSQKTIEIDNITLNSSTPENYEIYDFYYEDLDSDKINEVIVLYQESRTYNDSDRTDLPRSLPLRISIFDHIHGKWIASKSLPVVSNNVYTVEDGFSYQYAEIPYYLDRPYRLYQQEGKNWFLVYSYNGSFDGNASKVSIFQYDEKVGLEDFAIDSEAWASDGVIDKEDKLFFIACSSFWEESAIQAYQVDLKTDYPESKKLTFTQLDCTAFLEKLDEVEYEERPKMVEEILKENGIFLE